jgi:hypothetical protein
VLDGAGLDAGADAAPSPVLLSLVEVLPSLLALVLSVRVLLLSVADVLLRLSVTYQPEPLKMTPTGCNTRRVSPPQFGHTRMGSSLNDCSLSNRWRHVPHSYS